MSVENQKSKKETPSCRLLLPPADFFCRLLTETGGQGRNRTADAGLFRAALYQLSYLARWSERGRSIGIRFEECQLEAAN